LQKGEKGHIRPTEYITVKIRTNNISETVDSMKEAWDTFSPRLPFEYSFFDDDYNSLYMSEMQTGKIAGVFTMLAVFISCLGLFGMIAYIAEQRTKEIGIRKTLGASVSTITQLLSREYFILVLIANVISWPLGYIVMSRWLEQFAYRIDLGAGIFLISGITSLMIAVLTVSYQSLKAALANPVDSLRYE
jgi:putative ABC transport system permease protein